MGVGDFVPEVTVNEPEDSKRISRDDVQRFTMPVANPEWLDDGLRNARQTFDLCLRGRIPEKIKAWMIVTSCLRVLRAVYGDDLTTAAEIRKHILAKEAEYAHWEKKGHKKEAHL